MTNLPPISGKPGRVFALLFAVVAASLATSAFAQSRPATAPGLAAFRSDAELAAFLRRLRDSNGAVEEVVVPPPAPPIVPMPAPPATATVPSPPPEETVYESVGDNIVVTGARVAPPKITNTQEADVDEGGIVKIRGDTLVILRRGRLFTVSLAGGRMRPVDSINAFPPGVSGEDAWYDEMLLSGDRVIVVGYSYDRGGTEINRFRLDAAGRLRFEDAYHLKSNDYYSSRNYASRLIGDRLILYAPLELDWDENPLEALPGLRRWNGKDDEDDRPFRRIARARNVFIAPVLRDRPGATIDTLHSVTTCDLSAAVLDCSAVAVLGPESRTFYVSGQAVYLWISDAWDDERPRGITAQSFVFRLPFGRERPSAVGTRGAPVDQFSFREDRADGVLNVLVRSEGGDDAMFRPEFSEGSVALLRLPLRAFGNGSAEARRSRYRKLPAIEDDGDFQNRFVGNHVLYGGDGDDIDGDYLVAAPLSGGPAVRLSLPHGVGRIEALGRDALVVGNSEADLNFSAVELGAAPRLGDRYTLPAASEGESRSHAFFFSPDPSSPDGATGLLGLPISRSVDAKYEKFFGSAASMLFLHRQNRRFSSAGELSAKVEGTTEDGCQASCVDWYGNARPIFLGSRTFALLGYELVEGRIGGRRISEVARVNFAPPPKAVLAR